MLQVWLHQPKYLSDYNILGISFFNIPFSQTYFTHSLHGYQHSEAVFIVTLS